MSIHLVVVEQQPPLSSTELHSLHTIDWLSVCQPVSDRCLTLLDSRSLYIARNTRLCVRFGSGGKGGGCDNSLGCQLPTRRLFTLGGRSPTAAVRFSSATLSHSLSFSLFSSSPEPRLSGVRSPWALHRSFSSQRYRALSLSFTVLLVFAVSPSFCLSLYSRSGRTPTILFPSVTYSLPDSALVVMGIKQRPGALDLRRSRLSASLAGSWTSATLHNGGFSFAPSS